MKRKLIIVLLILWTAFIFLNSLRPAPGSIEQSDGVVRVLTTVVESVFGGDMPQPLAQYMASDFGSDVRDAAHIFEFMVLYIFAYMFFKKDSICSGKVLMNALYYSFLIAIIDENIQYYVPGRGFQASDLMKDAVGSLIAMAGIAGINYLRCKIGHRTEGC
ncbi:MAG: VanZ family protein [Clostridia bacterium]